ncbi:MAG: hypothetical protein IT183_06875 [Acidobacteria bacterium]|nr:hypothetical protein [Acidobacteriota bacterium]
MSLANLTALIDAEMAGQTKIAGWRKVPAVVTVAGAWYDYSMAPGNPAPQYYASTPLVSVAMRRSTDGGVPHQGTVSPATQYLRGIQATCVTAGGVPQRFLLCDYLLYYPFLDMGTAEAQALTTSATLPRYTDGVGVQMMAVLVAPHGLAGDTFTVTYTNQDGTAGRVTPAHTMTTGVAVNGTLITSQSAGIGRNGPWMTLQAGDTGVRSVEAVTCAAGIDVGLFTLVLVKPLAEFSLRGIDAPTETCGVCHQAGKLPIIVDDAYLNFVACPAGSLSAAAVNGLITTTWV